MINGFVRGWLGFSLSNARHHKWPLQFPQHLPKAPFQGVFIIKQISWFACRKTKSLRTVISGTVPGLWRLALLITMDVPGLSTTEENWPTSYTVLNQYRIITLRHFLSLRHCSTLHLNKTPKCSEYSCTMLSLPAPYYKHWDKYGDSWHIRSLPLSLVCSCS